MDINKVLQQYVPQLNVPYVPTMSNKEPLQNQTTQSLKGDTADRFKDRPLQDEQNALLRLQYDFEFVQHLVSPEYVRFLFQKKYFEKQEFLNYLEYLNYWRRPEYQKLLIQPRCLDVLEMLLKEEVRLEIERHPDFTNYFSL